MVGVVRKYSDALLTLKLRRHRPDQYRERVQVNADVATRRVMIAPPSSMDDDAWGGVVGGPAEGAWRVVTAAARVQWRETEGGLVPVLPDQPDVEVVWAPQPGARSCSWPAP